MHISCERGREILSYKYLSQRLKSTQISACSCKLVLGLFFIATLNFVHVCWSPNVCTETFSETLALGLLGERQRCAWPHVSQSTDILGQAEQADALTWHLREWINGT